MKVYNQQTLEEIHVDFNTRNISFLRMAAILQANGNKNYYFFLQLNDKGLRGIDPYDPDLSTEMKFRIFRECATNRWYFFREVMRVTEAGASVDVGGGTHFELNRGNLAYLWAMSMNISAYLIMPRQTGKTWAALADCVWTHQFIRGSSILHFNKNQGDANDNLRRIQDSIRMLPMYLQHSNLDNLDPKDKRRVKNNEKSIRNTLNSTIEAMASAGNEAKADAIARGRTASKIWFDELAYIFFNETIYAAAMPAYAKAAEIADKNGAPFAISITTTPGDLATPHGEFAYRMMDNAIPFRENMYDLKRKKLFDVIHNTVDKTGFLFIQFNHLQLGETDEWYLTRFRNMNNPVRARREFLLEWINSNGNSPFDPDDLEIIGDMVNMRAQKVETYKINKYYTLNVYEEYHGKKPVIISVDVAGSMGRDSTAVVVINPETLRPIAIFRSNMIPSDKLRKLLVTLVTKRYPHCILTVENNSIGKPLLDELKETVIRRVLYREKKKIQVDVGVRNATRKRTIEEYVYGHNTNANSRAQMMEMLESIVHNAHGHVAYPELYNEIRYMEVKNGRINHSSATHDDCTMAYLGGLWIVRYGNGGLHKKGIFYTLQDQFDESEREMTPNGKVMRTARRMLLQRDLSEEDEIKAAIYDYMMEDHPIDDSGTLAHEERMRYYHELDRIEGILDEEEDQEGFLERIPIKTQKAVLRNYFSVMGAIEDPAYFLSQEPRIIDFEEEREKESWATLYKY